MNTNKPQVSVIVTTYNREKYLKETIQSILDQTFTDFELIVVDNFSNYDFFEVMESFNDSRIKPFQNQNNGIIAVNRNYGISKATGKYLAFCDDDDLWMPEKLEKQVSLIEVCRADVVCSNIVRFSKTIENVNPVKVKDFSISLGRLLRKNPIATSSVLIKKSSIVYFSESPMLITIEDYDLWIRLFMEGYSIYYIGQPLIYYRVSQQNTSRGINNVLLPIRRMYMLSAIKLKYNFKSTIYICSILINLMEFTLKKLIRR